MVGRVPRIDANDDINKKILYDQHFRAALSEFTEAYKRLSPHPAPTLIVVGDHDFTTVEHAAIMLVRVGR